MNLLTDIYDTPYLLVISSLNNNIITNNRLREYEN